MSIWEYVIITTITIVVLAVGFIAGYKIGELKQTNGRNLKQGTTSKRKHHASIGVVTVNKNSGTPNLIQETENTMSDTFKKLLSHGKI